MNLLRVLGALCALTLVQVAVAQPAPREGKASPAYEALSPVSKSVLLKRAKDVYRLPSGEIVDLHNYRLLCEAWKHELSAGSSSSEESRAWQIDGMPPCMNTGTFGSKGLPPLAELWIDGTQKPCRSIPTCVTTLTIVPASDSARTSRFYYIEPGAITPKAKDETPTWDPAIPGFVLLKIKDHEPLLVVADPAIFVAGKVKPPAIFVHGVVSSDPDKSGKPQQEMKMIGEKSMPVHRASIASEARLTPSDLADLVDQKKIELSDWTSKPKSDKPKQFNWSNQPLQLKSRREGSSVSPGAAPAPSSTGKP